MAINIPAPGRKSVIGGLSAAAISIIAAVLSMEGGFVDNVNDPGGATKHGVTEKVARAKGYTGSMRDLPEETAQSIYFEDYIAKPGYAPLVDIDPAVAEEVIDSGVNAGPGRSSRWLQSSLNSLNRRGADYLDIAVDGDVGPGTIRAFESLRKVRGEKQACQMVIRLMDAQQAVHYMQLGGQNSKFETFTPGWIIHRIGNVDLARCGKH